MRVKKKREREREGGGGGKLGPVGFPSFST